MHLWRAADRGFVCAPESGTLRLAVFSIKPVDRVVRRGVGTRVCAGGLHARVRLYALYKAPRREADGRARTLSQVLDEQARLVRMSLVMSLVVYLMVRLWKGRKRKRRVKRAVRN